MSTLPVVDMTATVGDGVQVPIDGDLAEGTVRRVQQINGLTLVYVQVDDLRAADGEGGLVTVVLDPKGA